MCKAMEDMREEVENKLRIRLALKMLEESDLSYEQIAKCYELTLEQVKELAQAKSA